MNASQKEKQFRDDYYNYYSIVFSAIYSKLRIKEDAEDICSEVFISYYHKLEEVEEPRKWLLGAIKYAISNYYRKKDKGVHKSEMSDIADAENDPALAFVNGARDVRIMIQQALDEKSNFKNNKEKICFEGTL